MQPYLECADIIKIYPQKAKVKKATLRGLDLLVSKGEFISILGPSGSGKTTLLMIIAGLLEPSSGMIKIGELLLNELAAKKRLVFYRQTMGLLFQNPRENVIWEMSCFDNVMLPMVLASGQEVIINKKHRAVELLKAVGLEIKARITMNKLSGGELQRLGLAIALANDPEILLLDEPTSQLDTRNAMKIIAHLKNLCTERNKTVILVTHDSRIIDQTDRAYIMKRGTLEQFGPVKPEIAN